MPKPIYRTLRFRLTFWNTVVLILASGLALLASREGMRLTLTNETRDLLREEVTELELAVQQIHPDLDEIKSEFTRKIRGHSQHRWFAELLDSDQNTIWRSETYPDLDNLNSEIGNQQGTLFRFSKNEDLILAQHPVEVKSGERFGILLGTPTEFIQRDVWNLTKVMLGIGAVLVLIAPLGGYLLARHATQPVREIIETTRRLDPANLQHRLVVRGTNDELDQISTEINSFLDQISKYLQSNRDFVANAAHELRSPLTAIQTSVDVSLTKDRSTADYRDQLETVSEQCEQLRHLVNQLLQLAETDTTDQRPHYSEFDLSVLVKRSLEFFSGIAEEKNIEMVADLGSRVWINGDPQRIRQVVNNLIDNALKFTPEQGTIGLSLARAGGKVKLTITDTGCGVPELELPRVFDRFYQVDPSRSRANGQGNGLGLSICQSIVAMHGGQIEIQNVEPGGTRVQITF